MTVSQPVLAAWQVALRAEERAAFGYTVLGPHLAAAHQELARTLQALHEQARDTTAEAIAAAGAVAAAPQGDYPDLYGVAPLTLAAELEDDCAAGWRWFYAALADATADQGGAKLRDTAQRGLTGSAVRATRWRLIAGSARPLVAFPGTSAQK